MGATPGSAGGPPGGSGTSTAAVDAAGYDDLPAGHKLNSPSTA